MMCGVVKKKEIYYKGGGYAKEKTQEIYGTWWDIHYPKTIKFKRYDSEGKLMQRYVKKINENFEEGEWTIRSFNVNVNPKF